jgi:signal peptidase I
MTQVAPVAEHRTEAAQAQTRAHTSIGEYIESLLVTVILALFGTTFVVQAFKIPSQSMEPTLLVGDHLLVNKFIFGGRDSWYEKLLPYRSVRRDDIIVFKFPFQDHPHYVKRVIGVPGDRIKIVNQKVYRNGEPLSEPYAVHDPAAPYDPFLFNFPPASREELTSGVQAEWADQIFKYVQNGELVVPPGNFFAMGDNRDHSWDSRFWGFVSRDAIMGGPVVIYWSVQSSEEDYSERSFGGGLVSILRTLIEIPTRTRWNRMLRTVH